MIFFNLGDGYSSGCCTGCNFFFSADDPRQPGYGDFEHPNNRPGSFINQLAELVRATSITIAKHRTTIEEIIDNADDTINIIKKYNQESIVFLGIPDLYSQKIDDQYLLLDGKDITFLPEEQYIEYCNSRESQDIDNKINDIENYLNKISKVVDKIIIYRTTAQPFNLSLPDNAVYTDISVIDYLKHLKPYRRGYYDTSSYKKISREFIKLI